MLGAKGVMRCGAITGAALLAAAVLFGAGPAQAGTSSSSQPCGLVQAQPSAVFFAFLTTVGDLFPLPEEECIKIVEEAIKACHKAVRETEQCIDQAIASLHKSSKTGCSLEGDSKGECNDFFAGEREDAEAENAANAANAHEVCDGAFADELFEACIEGIDE